ncbi:MAG: carboxypeptidase M32 [Steroidobacteraceae bacterium]|jgi:carboxypeptidase Taq|nr:carboxypeptidase M32 [Steroidobacteraceae bacterium]
MAVLTPYEQLEQEFRRLHAFRGALAVLRWDAAVTMPRGSSDVRGEQLAAIETECHSVLTSPRLTRLLERAEASAAGLRDWQRANLREMRRERDHAIATPPSLVARLARATARAEALWREARERNDFAILAPALDEVLRLTRNRAAMLGQHMGLDPYDALLDEYTPGLLSADIDGWFATLAQRLPTLVSEVVEAQEARPVAPIAGRFPASKQRALCVDVMKALGFPFDRGRFDGSERTFTEGVPGDIRVTTRFDPAEPFTGLLGALHETGQALYDLGLPSEWLDQPVGQDRGMALDESQSLLLEMVVGRSRAFVDYLLPLLARHFGLSGPEWSADNVYRRLTRVQRGPSRMDADELTYQAHIVVRYELERRLLSGDLPVQDLPGAWNELMERRLGLCPANDTEGCLQDVHWALGSFGYFPSYAIGAVIASQLWESLREDLPELDGDIRRGEFARLTGWLRSNVHALGAKMTVPDLVKHATGRPLSVAPHLRYLERKYLTDW